MSGHAVPPEAWSEWGGEGPRLVFAHANGFPPATYRMLLEALSARFQTAAFAARPLWPHSDPSQVSSWRDLAADLRHTLEEKRFQQGIGVGHSLGGVLTVFTAAAAPTLFTALVLIDPVVFSGLHALFWGSLKSLGFSRRLPLIRGARRRRAIFPDLDAVRANYQGKSVFASWDRDALEDYIRAAFVETESGEVTLRYAKDWESRVFELTPASVWSDLSRVTVPTLVIKGASSDTFLGGAARKMRRRLADATVVELAGTTHFLPMECPQAVTSTIFQWYERVFHSV